MSREENETGELVGTCETKIPTPPLVIPWLLDCYKTSDPGVQGTSGSAK